jgi:uncharacterized membrane protein (Fun14 family)
MMILGIIIMMTTERTPPSPADPMLSPEAAPGRSHADENLLSPGFAPTRPSAPGDPPASDRVLVSDSADDSFGVHDLSPFMVKGGFGLFIGFAIGFAVRAFLRLAVVITGFYFLVLTMMAYAGLIEIHWNLLETKFTGLVSFLGGQFESFKTFLTGAIPASTLTTVGFIVGLRRK